MSCKLIVLVLGLAVAVSAAVQVRKIMPKIVGGKSADIRSFPYQVSVTFINRHSCGGSIIHPSWILTAAHCVRFLTAANYTIRAGSSSHSSGGVRVQVSRIIKHPFYRVNFTHNYDVALLKLETPLTTSKCIRTISLSDTEPREGDLLLISGWGSLRERGSFSEMLQTTALPVVSTEKCKEIYEPRRLITQSMFCAGFPAGGRDSCKGDSGGPAVFNRKLVGIVSWGTGCGRPNTPGVYTIVAAIKNWVESQII